MKRVLISKCFDPSTVDCWWFCSRRLVRGTSPPSLFCFHPNARKRPRPTRPSTTRSPACLLAACKSFADASRTRATPTMHGSRRWPCTFTPRMSKGECRRWRLRRRFWANPKKWCRVAALPRIFSETDFAAGEGCLSVSWVRLSKNLGLHANHSLLMAKVSISVGKGMREGGGGHEEEEARKKRLTSACILTAHHSPTQRRQRCTTHTLQTRCLMQR